MLSRLQLVGRHLRLSPFHQGIRAPAMSTFVLPDTKPPVPVQLTHDLSQTQLLSFPAFKIWLSTLNHSLSQQRLNPAHEFHAAPYSLRGIHIQAVDVFGGDRLGFVKLKADVSNDEGEKLPGSVFLRGGSVGMLLILQPDDVPGTSNSEKCAILTVQPRIPAGSLTFVELPAGMIDDSGSFAGGAAKEIQEETGLSINQDELIDLTALTILETKKRREGNNADDGSSQEDKLQDAMYPSPGGSDEFIPLFLCQKRMPRKDIEQMQGQLTGLRKEGEKITLKLIPLDDLWREGVRDAKALGAWALYEGLRKEGCI